MAGELAGRFDSIRGCDFCGNLDWPRPEQPERPAGRGHDGRFEALLGGTVEDQRDPSTKAFEDMLRRGSG